MSQANTNIPTSSGDSLSQPKKSRVSRGGKANQSNSNSNSNSHTRRTGGGYRRNNNNNGIDNDNNPSSNTGNKKSHRVEEEDIPEGQQCLICAERIEFAALTPCNHTTCHRCTFRQRALYEKNNCLICRSENERIIITEQVDKEYDDFKTSDIICSNETYKIDFTQDYVRRETLRLLDNECAICHESFATFRELGDHAKEAHGKYYCLICSKFKKAFKIELPLYTYKGLQKHQASGDESSGFGGHPECKHCHGKRFYSEDELNVHIRERHERCHICDKTSPKTADYYKNYDALYRHFSQSHYVCTVASCVEKKFVVFRDDLDLTAHMLKEHGGLSNGNRVVIGSNSMYHHNNHHHNNINQNGNSSRQIQLSTFNTARWLTSNNDQEEDQHLPEIKKRRFEERARHYLNYDNNRFREFTKLNETFKHKKINARELLQIYKQNLFIHQTMEELNFLIKGFSDLFPQGSELQKDLLSVIIQENEDTPSEQFPILGGRSAASAFTASGWINGSGSGTGTGAGPSRSGTASPVDNFPVLKKPAKKVNYINPNEQPIRYTTVLKKTTVKKPVSGVMSQNLYQGPSSIPNYLDNTSNKSKSAQTNLSASSSRNGSSASLSSSMMSRNLDDDRKFPVLQKKSTKKVIPRVNEVKIVDPSQWGRESPLSIDAMGDSGDGIGANVMGSSSSENIEIVDKRKQKMKKKQDRLLFSNAF
ncbi:hypothetical protein PVL30_005459 [Lodderomyces elongisporus]|uniref:uncharacterized protein n=1 Tax=Lodderomyces elongisporus TaxID=36914 RepID=UPI00291F2C86|nr:uncharacterized protein PVL30_005459 [Lodderomyces elongisporus]WLF81660.1 hypothetical protein PVL30_005459 [Lodderomyces elongisporus]